MIQIMPSHDHYQALPIVMFLCLTRVLHITVGCYAHWVSVLGSPVLFKRNLASREMNNPLQCLDYGKNKTPCPISWHG